MSLAWRRAWSRLSRSSPAPASFSVSSTLLKKAERRVMRLLDETVNQNRQPTNFHEVLRASKLPSPERMDEAADKFLAIHALQDVYGRDARDDINWDKVMSSIKTAEQAFPMKYIDPAEKEEMTRSLITHNLAKVINQSDSLKKMVDLGVDLAKWERSGWRDLALRLDFDRDVAPRVHFLISRGIHDLTVIASLLSDNGPLLEVDLDDLNVRVNYLASKSFSPKMVVKILSENPFWLCYSVSEIDGRLGYFQKTFKLSGEEVRRVASACPKLVTWGGVPTQVGLNLIMLSENCGFSRDECKEILLKCPSIYYEEVEDRLSNIVSFLHNDVGFSHEMLARRPEAIAAKINHIRPRLAFLRSLGRHQVDPSQPNYVSPQAFAQTTDLEFCDALKCSIDTYNEFLKTM